MVYQLYAWLKAGKLELVYWQRFVSSLLQVRGERDISVSVRTNEDKIRLIICQLQHQYYSSHAPVAYKLMSTYNFKDVQ
jgi:hypothetical protein